MVTCPNPDCGSTHVDRDTRRIARASGGHCNGGWYVCLRCWRKWDGVSDKPDGLLPPDVEPRPSLPGFEAARTACPERVP